MKTEENIYDTLMRMFGQIPKNVNILEEQIGIDTQMSYFEISQKYKKTKFEEKEIETFQSKLNDNSTSNSEKKEILAELAHCDNVDAYRIIESFNKEADDSMKDWAVLALQESRMSIESYLLNEDQIIISTGLGGKDNKLRYFLAFSTNSKQNFTELQQRLLTKELEFSFKNNDGEIENLEFSTRFCTLTALLPISTSIQNMIDNAIDECNQIGNFLDKRFIVTNVNVLSLDEISGHWDTKNDIK